MKPFLILVLVLTLMASVLVYKMLADTYEGSFAPTKSTAANESEPTNLTSGTNQLEADVIRAYHSPDNGRPHSMNTVPAEPTVAPAAGARWE